MTGPPFTGESITLMKLLVPSLPLSAGHLACGDEEFFQVLPEVVVPVEQGKGGLAGLPELVLDRGVREQEEKPLHWLAVKRHGAGREVILDEPVLPVGRERAVFGGKFLLQLVELGLHRVRARLGIAVVDRQFEEPSAVEPSLQSLGSRIGQIPFSRGNLQDAKRGLISGQRDVNIQGMSGSPINQLFRSIAPAQAEGWLQNSLATGPGSPEPQGEDGECQVPDGGEHGGRLPFFRRSRKPAGVRRGSVLIETTIAMTMLSILGLALLKLSLNVTAPRQWTLQQTVTDAYMTFEKASAQRQSFDQLTSANSLWPVYPTMATTTVEMGRLPGGRVINGVVTRTRFADPNNLPSKGGTGTSLTNPASMEVWRFQSIIRYQVAGRSYLKSRTVVRSQ